MRLVSMVVLAALSAPAGVAQSIGAVVARAEQLGARTGVCVLDDRGRVLFESRAGEAFAPASNMKLLTAAAVLQGLGAEHRFVTRFELVQGVLVARASGDPNWITATADGLPTAHTPELRFGEAIAALQQRGVTTVRDVVLDPGTFTGPTRPASWPQNQLHTYYCAPTGPFVLDQGVFALRIDPDGQQGQAAVAYDGPLIGPHVHGAIELVSKRGVSTCGAIDRGDHVLVRGKLSQRSSPVRIRTAVADPQVWYERSLRGLLARAGITVDPGAALPADGVVHEVATTIGPALLRMLEDSSNFDAEQLLRVLGDQTRNDGSLVGGLEALRAQAAELVGPLPPNVRFADGSGLSRDNQLTPALLCTALQIAATRPYGALLRAALPIAGRTGTLDDRFLGTDLVGRVWAKTGWIQGASALAGYVEFGGRTFVFAILMDYGKQKGVSNKDLKRLQEDIVAAIGQL